MQGAKLKGDDSVEDIVQCMDHDSVLFFTSDGVVRSLKAHQIPQASRTAIGTAITQVTPPLPTHARPILCPFIKEQTYAACLLRRSGLFKMPVI